MSLRTWFTELHAQLDDVGRALIRLYLERRQRRLLRELVQVERLLEQATTREEHAALED